MYTVSLGVKTWNYWVYSRYQSVHCSVNREILGSPSEKPIVGTLCLHTSEFSRKPTG